MVLAHFRVITKCKDLRYVFDWYGRKDTVSAMTTDMLLETASIFKKAYSELPMRSWPMSGLANLLRCYYRKTNPGELGHVQLTLVEYVIAKGEWE